MHILEMFDYGKRLTVRLEEAEKNLVHTKEKYLEVSREVEKLYNERKLLLENLIKVCTGSKDDEEA